MQRLQENRAVVIADRLIAVLTLLAQEGGARRRLPQTMLRELAVMGGLGIAAVFMANLIVMLAVAMLGHVLMQQGIALNRIFTVVTLFCTAALASTLFLLHKKLERIRAFPFAPDNTIAALIDQTKSVAYAFADGLMGRQPPAS